MNYYISQTVHLSLEKWHNSGLTKEETKEVIENTSMMIIGGISYSWRPHCRQSGINNNWSFEADVSMNRDDIKYLIFEITMGLQKKLKHKMSAEQQTT